MTRGCPQSWGRRRPAQHSGSRSRYRGRRGEFSGRHGDTVGRLRAEAGTGQGDRRRRCGPRKSDTGDRHNRRGRRQRRLRRAKGNDCERRHPGGERQLPRTSETFHMHRPFWFLFRRGRLTTLLRVDTSIAFRSIGHFAHRGTSKASRSDHDYLTARPTMRRVGPRVVVAHGAGMLERSAVTAASERLWTPNFR